MSRPEIELHVRHQADLPTLRALHRALERAGASPVLTAAAEIRTDRTGSLQPGPLPCEVRVLVAGAPGVPRESAGQLVVIEDRLLPPGAPGEMQPPPEVLSRADLVLVPGPAHVPCFEPLCGGSVVPSGIARLEAIWQDPEGERARARCALGIPAEARVLVYAATGRDRCSAVELLGDELARVAEAGWLGLVLPRDWPLRWVEEHRLLVARVPGLAMLDLEQGTRALAAADVVLADGGSLLYEGLVLGRGVVQVEVPGAAENPFGPPGPRVRSPDELAAALESVLPGTAAGRRFDAVRERCRMELLSCTGDAARRMAGLILERLPRGESDASPPPGSPVAPAAVVAGEPGDESAFLEAIEARVSFGDHEGARTALAAHLARRPSARAYCLLASIERRSENLQGARSAVERAEPLARADLGLALCERGRLQVEAGEMEAAAEAFEEAARVAPDSVDPWIGLGSLALHRQDPARAEECFRQALAQEPSSRIWSGLGLALVAQQRGRQAIPCFEAALDQDPESISAIYGLVQSGFQAGELRVPEQRVRAYVELHSGNLDLLFTLAGLRCQLGDLEGAREMVERVAVFQSDYPGLEELRQKLGGRA